MGFAGITFDVLRIRKYTTTEPTQTPGSETQLKNPLDDWTYKRSHVLTGDSLTYYQVKVLVNYGSGESSEDTVYLNGRCKPDFGDIRFTDNDNNEIPYWIESVSGTLATIWVKVPSITSDSYIYIYYGNESAATTSIVIQPSYSLMIFHNTIGVNWIENYSYTGAGSYMSTHTIENGGTMHTNPVLLIGCWFNKINCTNSVTVRMLR